MLARVKEKGGERKPEEAAGCQAVDGGGLTTSWAEQFREWPWASLGQLHPDTEMEV